MRLDLDQEADALYLRFSARTPVQTVEVSDGVMLDFDAEGRVVGIEVINVSAHAGAWAAQSVVIER